MPGLPMVRFWLMAFAIVIRFPITAPLVRAADDKTKGDTTLEDEMIAANKALKVLKTQINDGSKNQSSLQLMGEMQKHFLAVKGMEPARAKKEADKAKFLADYHR